MLNIGGIREPIHVGVCVCVFVCVCVYINIYIYREREREREGEREREKQTDRKKKKDRKTDRGGYFNGITHHSSVGSVSRDGMQHTNCRLQCFGAHTLYCSILGLYQLYCIPYPAAQLTRKRFLDTDPVNEEAKISILLLGQQYNSLTKEYHRFHYELLHFVAKKSRYSKNCVIM